MHSIKGYALSLPMVAIPLQIEMRSISGAGRALLDKLPPGRAFIGTSNLDLSQLTERFQTRFQSIKLPAPDSDEIRGFLIDRWKVPEPVASMIAVGSGGNVRAALADLETHFDAVSP